MVFLTIPSEHKMCRNCLTANRN